MNAIATYLELDDILLDVEIASKERLFDAIGQHMASKHALSESWVVAGLARREKLGSTGLGAGVAIPHARINELHRIQIAYLRLKTPVPFDAPDGMPVSDILVLLVPQQATEEHLQILAEATQYLADRKLRDQLHSCGSAAEVKQLFSSRRFSL